MIVGMVVERVVLFREKNSYVPALRCHEDDCKKKNGCCRWEDLPCWHLADADRKTASARAQKLARKIGVRYDGG